MTKTEAVAQLASALADVADVTTIAYHEAGHVVIGEAYLFSVRYVTIVPDRDRLGHVVFFKDESRRADENILVILGGLAAEAVFVDDFDWSRHDDLAMALKSIRPLLQTTIARYKVEAIAGALLAKKTLTGAEVRALSRLARRLADGSLIRKRRRFKASRTPPLARALLSAKTGKREKT